MTNCNRGQPGNRKIFGKVLSIKVLTPRTGCGKKYRNRGGQKGSFLSTFDPTL